MLGSKPLRKKDTREKKKWEVELENEDDESNLPDGPIENADSPKEDMISTKAPRDEDAANNGAMENESDKRKHKDFAWMSSDDEEKNDSDNEKVESEVKQNEEKKEELEDVDRRTLFVNQLDPELTEDDLNSYFQKYGRIFNIDLLKDEGINYNKGRAFIEYARSAEAQSAANDTNGRIIKSKKIEVRVGISTATSMADKKQRSKSRSESIDRGKKKRDHKDKRRRSRSRSPNEDKDRRRKENRRR